MTRPRIMLLAAIGAALAAVAAVAVVAFTDDGDTPPETLNVTVDSPAGSITDLTDKTYTCDPILAAAVPPDLVDPVPGIGGCTLDGRLSASDESASASLVLEFRSSGVQATDDEWRSYLDGRMPVFGGCTVTDVTVTVAADAYPSKGGCYDEIGGRSVTIAVATTTFALQVEVTALASVSRQRIAEAATGILERAVDETLRAVS